MQGSAKRLFTDSENFMLGIAWVVLIKTATPFFYDLCKYVPCLGTMYFIVQLIYKFTTLAAIKLTLGANSPINFQE